MVSMDKEHIDARTYSLSGFEAAEPDKDWVEGECSKFLVEPFTGLPGAPSDRVGEGGAAKAALGGSMKGSLGAVTLTCKFGL